MSFNSVSQTGLKFQVGLKLSCERDFVKPGQAEHSKSILICILENGVVIGVA